MDESLTPVPHNWTSFSDVEEDKGQSTVGHLQESTYMPTEPRPPYIPPGDMLANANEAVWLMTEEQRLYYTNQFMSLGPLPGGLLPGNRVKAFFDLSKLPVKELSKIWEMSDVDCDGHLNLTEFCIAMHLVVLRKNDIPVPETLPACLHPLALLGTKGDNPFLSNADTVPTHLSSAPYQSIAMAHSSPLSMPQPIGSVSYPAPPLASSLPSSGPGFKPMGSVRSRRLSNSSQSDISSIAESLISFDNKPPTDVTRPHPVGPMSLGIRPSLFPDVIPAPIAIRPTTDSTDHTDGSHMHHMRTQFTHIAQAPSLKAGTPPPPPPPRSRAVTLPATALKVNEESNKPEEDINTNQRSVFSDANPQVGDESGNYEANRLCYKKGIEDAREVCVDLVKVNKELSAELKEVQEQRVSLEIMLEHLMPLEY